MVIKLLTETFHFSERKACRLLSISRNTARYKARNSNINLIAKLRWLAVQHPRYGSPRLAVLLRRNGFFVNHKKVERLCRIEGLTLKRRKKRRIKIQRLPTPMIASHQAMKVWGIDFVHDKLIDGQKFRCLTIIDHHSRVCPGLLVKHKIHADDVVQFLEQIRAERGLPENLNMDNGSEFTSGLFSAWCASHRINIRYIQPGKPIENAFIESFNGRFRDECLNLNKFKKLRHAVEEIEIWRNYYNHERPHSSLNYRSPIEETVPNQPGDSR